MKYRTPAWLNKSHTNFDRWERARELSIQRGRVVDAIVCQNIKTKNLYVLDLGSGEGGTAEVFSRNNFVVSFDLSLVRLKRQSDNNFNASKVNGSALLLPFCTHSFDLIIIQDVIEHIINIDEVLLEIKRILKTNGTVYLSTPNKFSVINLFSDPHFGFPVVSILKRESIKKYFLKYFRKDDYIRDDIAQLSSLNELVKLFQKDFKISLYTKFSVKELFNGNKGIIWSTFHFKLISLCKFIKIDWLIMKISNDKFGLINKYFTPTFYFTLSKN